MPRSALRRLVAISSFLCLLMCRSAAAEVAELRVAIQDGLAYLPFILMEHNGLVEKHAKAAGIDNLNNRKYFLFHPFPQRTIVAELRHTF